MEAPAGGHLSQSAVPSLAASGCCSSAGDENMGRPVSGPWGFGVIFSLFYILSIFLGFLYKGFDVIVEVCVLCLVCKVREA